MAWLPLADRRYQDIRLQGQVYYAEDQAIDIPASAVDQRFRDIVKELISRLASTTPARKAPAPQNAASAQSAPSIALKGEKNRGIRNAAFLSVRPIDRRPRTGRPSPGPDSLAGALLPQGLPALGRSPRAPAQAPAVRPPFLERRGRSDRYLAQINSLANALENTGEPPQDSASFDTWCTRYLSHDRSPKPELPHNSTPRARRCTPRATLLNAGPSSPSARRCQETRTSFSSAGTTTRTGCSPGI